MCMCVRRSRKARGVGTRARHKLSEYVLWLCGRYPFNFPKGFPEGLHPPGFPMGYTPLNSPRGFPEGLYPLEFPRACTLLNSPRSSPRGGTPCVQHTALWPARSPLSSAGCVTSPGLQSVVFCSGCATSPGRNNQRGLVRAVPSARRTPPNRFFVVPPFLYLLWGAPRPQGATIHHQVSL